MTATATATIDGTAASSGRLSSVASRVLDFVWPMYLTLVFTLGAWVLVPTVILGWQPVTIISGSMSPAVPPGHVVVVEPYGGQDLGPGMVVTYRDAEQDRLVTHRITGLGDDGTYTTRGDANAVDDRMPLTPDRIVGVGRLVVPAAGLPALWVHQGRIDLLAMVAVLTVVATGAAASAASDGTRSLRRRLCRGRGVSRRAQVRTVGLATAGVAIAVALGATTLSRAAFVGAEDNAANSFGASTVSAPTGVTASADCVLLLSTLFGPAVELSWVAAPGATAYEITRTEADGSGLTTLSASTTSFRDDTVRTATTYHYTVRGRAGSWTGAPSAVAVVKTPLLCVI